MATSPDPHDSGLLCWLFPLEVAGEPHLAKVFLGFQTRMVDTPYPSDSADVLPRSLGQQIMRPHGGFKMQLKSILVVTLVLLGLGGWLKHVSVHPFVRDDIFTPLFLVPVTIGILDVAVVPALFISRKWAPLGYLLNGMFVLLGTILMLHFPFLTDRPPRSLDVFVFNTTFRDVVTLWGDFMVGAVLYRMVTTQKGDL